MSRFPPLKRENLDEEHKELHDKLATGAKQVFDGKGFIFQQSDGALVGPFAPLLYTHTEIAEHFYNLVTSLSKIPGLSASARETAILATGAQYKCKYEMYAHERISEATGVLSRKQLDRLVKGESPVEAGEEGKEVEEIRTAYEVTVALINDRGPLKDEVWNKAVKVFGKMGAMAVVHYVGAYLYTCMILNGFDVPLPSQGD